MEQRQHALFFVVSLLVLITNCVFKSDGRMNMHEYFQQDIKLII